MAGTKGSYNPDCVKEGDWLGPGRLWVPPPPGSWKPAPTLQALTVPKPPRSLPRGKLGSLYVTTQRAWRCGIPAY